MSQIHLGRVSVSAERSNYSHSENAVNFNFQFFFFNLKGHLTSAAKAQLE